MRAEEAAEAGDGSELADWHSKKKGSYAYLTDCSGFPGIGGID
jgi:hypothetical protein